MVLKPNMGLYRRRIRLDPSGERQTQYVKEILQQLDIPFLNNTENVSTDTLKAKDETVVEINAKLSTTHVMVILQNILRPTLTPMTE